MKNMEITDANIILRYLLKDNADFFLKASNIIEKNKIFIPVEVCAEVDTYWKKFIKFQG